MRLGRVRAGDIVRCDVKGHIFHGLVVDHEAEGLRLRPLEHNITWYTVTAHQVIEHFKRAGLGRVQHR